MLFDSVITHQSWWYWFWIIFTIIIMITFTIMIIKMIIIIIMSMINNNHNDNVCYLLLIIIIIMIKLHYHYDRYRLWVILRLIRIVLVVSVEFNAYISIIIYNLNSFKINIHNSNRWPNQHTSEWLYRPTWSLIIISRAKYC